MRALLRIRAPMPDKLILRDYVAAEADGVAKQLSLARALDTEAVYESEIVDFKSTLSLKPAARDLVLELLFYEGSGTVVHDSSGYGNNGSVYGASWGKTESGKTYLELDGEDDYVEVPHSDSLNFGDPGDKWTVEVLFAPTKIGEITYFIEKRTAFYAGGGVGWNIKIERTKLAGGLGDGTNYYYDGQFKFSPDLEAGRVYHAVIIFDRESSTLRAFWMGSPFAEYDISKVTGSVKNTANLEIGRTLASYPYHCTAARLFLIRIWRRALSDAEAAQLYEMARKMVPELG